LNQQSFIVYFQKQIFFIGKYHFGKQLFRQTHLGKVYFGKYYFNKFVSAIKHINNTTIKQILLKNFPISLLNYLNIFRRKNFKKQTKKNKNMKGYATMLPSVLSCT
jgi:hypothetical protein